MLQPYPHLRPWRRQRKPLRPLQNHYAWPAEQVFHPQRLKIMKIFDAIQVSVKNRLLDLILAVAVQQGKSGARYVLFPRRSEPAYDSLRQRRLSTPQIPAQQHEHRRFQPRSKLTPPGCRLLCRMRHNLLSHRAESPLTILAAHTAAPAPLLLPAFPTQPRLRPAFRRPAHAAMLPVPERAANHPSQTVRSVPPEFPSARRQTRPSPAPDFPWCSQTAAHRARPRLCEILSTIRMRSSVPPLRSQFSPDPSARRNSSPPAAATSPPDAE